MANETNIMLREHRPASVHDPRVTSSLISQWHRDSESRLVIRWIEAQPEQRLRACLAA
jgi:hypothetical protein